MSLQLTAKICLACTSFMLIVTGFNSSAFSDARGDKGWHCHKVPDYASGRLRKFCHGYTVTKPRLPKGSERKDLRKRPIKKR